jgi:hypothetical protein
MLQALALERGRSEASLWNYSVLGHKGTCVLEAGDDRRDSPGMSVWLLCCKKQEQKVGCEQLQGSQLFQGWQGWLGRSC